MSKLTYASARLMGERVFPLFAYPSAMAHASTIAEQNSVERLTENEFISRFNPVQMGNTADIAYGGCAVGVGVQAAYQTVKPGFHVYSVMGHYLGPAMADRKIICKVSRLRDTRTFATRFIEASQKLDDGSIRTCVAFLADFQVRERASFTVVYCAATIDSIQPGRKSDGDRKGRGSERAK